MTSKPKAAVLIGLDGATFSVLDPLIEAGKMPFLGNLMATGIRAELTSTVPPTTPPAWTTLMTGRSPANHGIFDFFVPEARGSHSLRLVNTRHITCETIWSLLSRNGCKSVSLNFPVMAPPIPFSGYSMSGFVSWKYLRRACHPPDLMDQLMKIPGFALKDLGHNFKMEEKSVEGCSLDEAEDWILCHTEKDKQWVSVLEYLMKTDPCHLTAIVLDSPDRLQHAFWRLLDPSCVDGPLSADEKRIRTRIIAHFVELDRMIARIVGSADPETDIFIVSDHGFGPTRECFFLNTWLAERGYLEWSSETTVPEASHTDFSMEALRKHTTLLNWDKTTAYVFSPSSNGIRVNLAQGGSTDAVRPEEYDNLMARLSDELRAIRHPTQGFPIIQELWTRKDLFGGAESAPDLTVRLWDNGFVSTLKSNHWIKTRSCVAGTHYPNGIFIANGQKIRGGVTLDALSIIDIAPTLLYSMGLPVPEDLEGNVSSDTFQPGVVKSEPVRKSAPTLYIEPQSAAEDGRNREEEKAIMMKLMALGYLE